MAAEYPHEQAQPLPFLLLVTGPVSLGVGSFGRGAGNSGAAHRDRPAGDTLVLEQKLIATLQHFLCDASRAGLPLSPVKSPPCPASCQRDLTNNPRSQCLTTWYVTSLLLQYLNKASVVSLW